MPRYTDTDALEKEMLFWSDTYGYGGLTKDNIREIIKNSPTADVVEVVRCRDCEYFDRAEKYCCDFLTAEEDGFCKWAKRKSE